ncbi:MAG TPA: amino acid ABC transporter ATP-binding protein [Candidatus Gastranaerophilaceae bacterium]|nr:amino acid ABC transporter ATP-binding protein [Candidatus Gastranaerophilaceae bacterium]HPT41384.1 amino acid ABC transporter ATP-binding protein [Candidatus Gastranaerophilaceae bacterium]
MTMIKLENVRKSYRTTRILNNVSFCAHRGEIVAIIGPSGCGKTTLLKCIDGLEKIDNGTITIEGHDITKKTKDLSKLRQNVGIVFQQYNLFPHMTVKQNIVLAPLIVKRMKKNDAEILAMLLLEKVGLLDKMDHYPHQLSGGQAQRVAIARTLAMKPKVVMFDEPTSALDPHMKVEVLEVIRKLKNQDMIILLVTHELKFAKEIADRVVFLYNGQVIENDSAQNVFNSPKNEVTKKYFEKISGAE